jgi:formate dehydrogenase subunit delta
MSDTKHDSATKLVRMANQISEFFAAQPGEQAAAGVLDHLTAFWTPKMRREIVDYVNNGGEGLTPLSRQAVDRLRQKS